MTVVDHYTTSDALVEGTSSAALCCPSLKSILPSSYLSSLCVVTLHTLSSEIQSCMRYQVNHDRHTTRVVWFCNNSLSLGGTHVLREGSVAIRFHHPVRHFNLHYHVATNQPTRTLRRIALRTSALLLTAMYLFRDENAGPHLAGWHTF